MKKLIGLLAVAVLSTSVMAWERGDARENASERSSERQSERNNNGSDHERGDSLDKAKELIGSLSYQDKEAYKAKFKELTTYKAKAQWFKKVIVAATSTENAINYLLNNNDLFAEWANNNGLLNEKGRIDKSSEAFKALEDKREKAWQKHVGNTQPIDHKPQARIVPIKGTPYEYPTNPVEVPKNTISFGDNECDATNLWCVLPNAPVAVR